jgi:hypothetical protein
MKFWIAILLILIPSAVHAQNLDKPIPIQPSQPSLSLWWQSDRLGQGLIEDWSIDSNSKLIRLQINGQAWLAADYVTRYTILQKLSSTARQTNYDIVLENNRQIKLAEYKYLNDKWQIDPPTLGANPFSANNGIFFGLR